MMPLAMLYKYDSSSTISITHATRRQAIAVSLRDLDRQSAPLTRACEVVRHEIFSRDLLWGKIDWPRDDGS
jgi:hypothetical protein